MGRCERCDVPPETPFGMHDYCAACGRNLCGDCMELGCCGAMPARSGMDEDYEASEQPEDAPLTDVVRLDLSDGTKSTVPLEQAVELLAKAYDMEAERVRELLRDGTPLATCFARYELNERRAS